MFQNKKLKRNATSAIAEVAEVALCASNCALPTSVNWLHCFENLFIVIVIEIVIELQLLEFE